MSRFKKGHSSFKRQTLKKQHSPVLKKLAIAFAIVLLAIALYIKVQPYTQEAKTRTKLESTQHQLIETKDKLQKSQSQSKAEEAEKAKQIDDLNKQIQEKDKQLEAKRAAAVVYAAALPTPAPIRPAYTPGGNKDTWLAASGIPANLWWAVDYIVSRESGWNPCAYYPGKSNCNVTAGQINATCVSYANGSCAVACGLGMSLPCGKWGESWTDPVNQLQHMNVYVQKFGGWAGAVAYWQAHGNY